MKRLIKIFLGGTCEGYNWRKLLEKRFEPFVHLELFNPIVDKWDDKAVENENKYKEDCDLCLFVITPFMEGCYSIAEAVDMSNKYPEKTIFVYLEQVITDKEKRYFTNKMLKSLKVTGELIERNGGKVFNDFDELVKYMERYN